MTMILQSAQAATIAALYDPPGKERIWARERERCEQPEDGRSFSADFLCWALEWPEEEAGA